MPYMINPFTKTLNYYEIGLPEGGESGEILAVDSTGTTFEWKPPSTAVGTSIVSNPGATGLRVTNIYVDSGTLKAVVEYDDLGTADVVGITSSPPPGHFKVLNIYVNNGKTVVEYDDTPQQ